MGHELLEWVGTEFGTSVAKLKREDGTIISHSLTPMEDCILNIVYRLKEKVESPSEQPNQPTKFEENDWRKIIENPPEMNQEVILLGETGIMTFGIRINNTGVFKTQMNIGKVIYWKPKPTLPTFTP